MPRSPRLLHDTVEDQEATFQGIEQRFGPVVREIVELATDSTEQPKAGWSSRKIAYLRRLDEKADDSVRYGGYLRVTLADKLHNARSIRADIWNDGDDRVFDLFRGAGSDRVERRARTLAYYSDAVRILARVRPPEPRVPLVPVGAHARRHRDRRRRHHQPAQAMAPAARSSARFASS